MIISELYKDYFQKSRAFLFPLTNMGKKCAFNPSCTYLRWKDVYDYSEYRLIATYNVDVASEKWKAFLENVIYKNPFFEDYSYTEDGSIAVVVFNLTARKEAFKAVLEGKYSKINEDYRSLIMMYYGFNTGEWAYMETFLIPSKYFKMYAEILGTEIERLERVGELVDPPNLEKENLILKTQRNSIKNLI